MALAFFRKSSLQGPMLVEAEFSFLRSLENIQAFSGTILLKPLVLDLCDFYFVNCKRQSDNNQAVKLLAESVQTVAIANGSVDKRKFEMLTNKAVNIHLKDLHWFANSNKQETPVGNSRPSFGSKKISDS